MSIPFPQIDDEPLYIMAPGYTDESPHLRDSGDWDSGDAILNYTSRAPLGPRFLRAQDSVHN